MSIPITCAGCQSSFDVPDTLAGKTIRCTNCKAQMTVPDAVEALDAVEAVEAVDAVDTVAGPAKKPFGFGSGAVPALKPAAKREDDTPSPKKAPPKPAPAPAPAAKRPAAKPVVDEDEEDDEETEKGKTKPKPAAKAAPAAKKGVVGSTRKSRDDDDDDDDDDDKPRKKKKAAAGGGGAMIAIIAVGVLGLAALAGGSIWYFTKSEDKPSETAANTSNTSGPNGISPGKPGPGGAGGPGKGPAANGGPGSGNTAGALPGDVEPGTNPVPAPGGMNPAPGGMNPPGNNPLANFMAGKASGTSGAWNTFASSDGYSVELPGTPVALTETDPKDSSVLKAQVLAVPGRLAIVTGMITPGPAALAATGGDPAKLLAATLKEMSKEGELKDAKPVTVNGHTGKSFSVPEIPVANGCVVVAAKDRLFMVLWIAPDVSGQVDGKRVASSLKITYRPDAVAGGPGTIPMPGPGTTVPMPGTTVPMTGGPGPMPGPGPGTVAMGDPPVMPPLGPQPGPGPGGNPFQPTPGAGGGEPAGDGNGNLKVKIESFYTAAFDTEKKEVYTIDARSAGAGAAAKTHGSLRRYSYPDFKPLGVFKLPQLGVRAAVDSKGGLLYVATVTSPNPNLTNPNNSATYISQHDSASASGDVAVYDLKAIREGTVEQASELKPVAVFSVKHMINGLELSSDGKMLYVLATTYVATARGTVPTKSHLAVFDTETRKEVLTGGKRKELPQLARDMAKTGDGKSLLIVDSEYASKRPGVYVFDTAGMAPQVPVTFPGAVLDVAPLSNGGGIATVLPMNNPAPGGNGPGGPMMPPGGMGPLGPIGGAIGGDRPGGPMGPGGGPPGAGGAAGTNFKLFLLDGKGGSTEMSLGLAAHVSNGGYAEYSPDNKRLFVSSWRGAGLDVYEVTDAAAANGLKLKSAVRTAAGNEVKGHFFLAPDGKAVVFHNGVVIDTENVGGGTPGVPVGFPAGGGMFPGGFPGMPPGGVVPPMGFPPIGTPPAATLPMPAGAGTGVPPIGTPPGGIPGMPGAGGPKPGAPAGIPGMPGATLPMPAGAGAGTVPMPGGVAPAPGGIPGMPGTTVPMPGGIPGMPGAPLPGTGPGGKPGRPPGP